MAWHSSPHPASNAMTYTLREAAQQLGIDLKTLRKKMDLLDIVPVPDAGDKRALLITDEQIELLARHLNLTRRTAAEPPTGERSLESMLIDVVKARERDLDMLSAALSERDRAIAVLSEREAALSEREHALTQQIEKLAAIVKALDLDLGPRIVGAVKDFLLTKQDPHTSQRSTAQPYDDDDRDRDASRSGTSRAGARR